MIPEVAKRGKFRRVHTRLIEMTKERELQWRWESDGSFVTGWSEWNLIFRMGRLHLFNRLTGGRYTFPEVPETKELGELLRRPSPDIEQWLDDFLEEAE